jgi:tetratricopeptide (TPR) repeat protein
VSDLTTTHLDEFTLLRLIAGDLQAEQCDQAADHVNRCAACAGRMAEIEELDSLMRRASEDGSLGEDFEVRPLPADDPFRLRPEFRHEPRRAGGKSLMAAVESSREGTARQSEILASSARSRALDDMLAGLRLDRAGDRFGLLYALQEAGSRIAESPVRMLRLAEAALQRLRNRNADETDDHAERIVPLAVLIGQAHSLAGQACNWTSHFQKAGSHLLIAYRSFCRAGDDVGVATVEHLESQRRFFLDRPDEALTLACRARRTFSGLGLEDMLARSNVAVGIALFRLGRREQALRLFRQAAAVFENRGLWSNYINCLNNIAACLQQTGRLEEARREYAKALRRFPRTESRSLAFLRHGLAEMLFSAGRYRDAALSVSRASRLYTELHLSARALTASLLEIESWARNGDLARARHRFEIFQAELRRHGELDPSVLAEIQRALSGGNPDFSRLSELRGKAQAHFQQLFQEASA